MISDNLICFDGLTLLVFQEIWSKFPLEIKGLLVRVTLAGRNWKRLRAGPKGSVAMARSLLLLGSHHS